MDEAVVVSSAELASDAQAARDLEVRARNLTVRVNAGRKQVGVVVRRAEEIREMLDLCKPGTAPLPLVSKYEDLLEDVSVARDYLYGLVAEATEWRFTPSEVRSWYERAVEMGCVRPQIGPALLEDLLYLRRVPNAPFREKVLALRQAGVVIEGAHARGEIFEHEKLDRLVGIEPKNNGAKKGKLRLYVTYEQGVALAHLLGMTPFQAGV